MKKGLLLAGCFLLFVLQNYAQLSVNGQLVFGSTDENHTDSLQITITNNTASAVVISGYRFYNTYAVPAFSTNASGLSIPASTSQSIWIRFSPRHNIYHNSELILFNDAHRGPLHVNLFGQGHFSNSYYNNSENLEEEALKVQLQTITGQNYNSLGYSNGARDYMFMTLDNEAANGQGASQNTIECVYTGREAVGYIDRVDCQTNDMFNTEHTFPQAFFNSNEPMKSDLFHIYPTDETANNVRASYPFGVVSIPTWSVGGSKYANSVFEPRDTHKGEVARAMFYFVMRYQNYNNFLDTQESILRQWHYQFLPTAIEKKRCNDISTQQMNRNPFIDYPQFVDRITSFSATSVAPQIYTADIVENAINFGLINTNQNYTYNFLVVNNGNQPLEISNCTLSTGFSFESPFNGLSNIIATGELLIVPVTVNVPIDGHYSGTLVFNTDDGAHPSVVVPIDLDAVTTGINEMTSEKIIVTPNPVEKEFHVSGFKFHVADVLNVSDLTGRVIYTTSVTTNDMIIDATTWNSGMYFLSVKGRNEIPVQKIIKK